MRKVASILVLACACGCSVIRIRDQQHGIVTTLYVPAWPWQDVNKSLSRLSVTGRTNGLTITMAGLNEETLTSSNAVELISQTVSAAVTAAIQSLK